jgi:hypothetical protein
MALAAKETMMIVCGGHFPESALRRGELASSISGQVLFGGGQ